MQAKATGKSKQVQSSELRCQEDGKGLCSCCCCLPSEGLSSAAKQELLGLGLHVLPSVRFSREQPKNSTFPQPERLRPFSSFCCLLVLGALWNSPNAPVPRAQPRCWAHAGRSSTGTPLPLPSHSTDI